ncbi:putative alpha/Beta hydrolase [Helianthus anomalus]
MRLGGKMLKNESQVVIFVSVPHRDEALRKAPPQGIFMCVFVLFFLCISGLFIGVFDVFDEPMMKSTYAAKQFVKRLPDKVIVHCSDCNYVTLTFDGVDRMGERLAEEMSKISFIAHSFGGLVACYAIGRLYENVPISRSSNLLQNDSKQSLEQLFEAKISGLQPVNFITVATPHLGYRRPGVSTCNPIAPCNTSVCAHSFHYQRLQTLLLIRDEQMVPGTFSVPNRHRLLTFLVLIFTLKSWYRTVPGIFSTGIFGTGIGWYRSHLYS